MFKKKLLIYLSEPKNFKFWFVFINFFILEYDTGVSLFSSYLKSKFDNFFLFNKSKIFLKFGLCLFSISINNSGFIFLN